MPLSSMRTAVLQATAIFVISEILHHHTSYNLFDGLTQDQGVQNFKAVMNQTMNTSTASATASSASRLTLGNGNAANQTSLMGNATLPINGTASSIDSSIDEPFYAWSLCRKITNYMAVSIMQYHWWTWLERLLPARPRRKIINNIHAGDGDTREEEVVKRWISQGRVNRASLNWCNTFLKWGLNMTIGRVLYHSCELFIRTCLRLDSPRVFLETWTTYMLVTFLGEIFSASPLATLLALIIVPAHEQIVFVAGGEFVDSLFTVTLIRSFTIWIVKTDFAQDVLRNIPLTAKKRLQAGKPLDEPRTHVDEL